MKTLRCIRTLASALLGILCCVVVAGLGLYLLHITIRPKDRDRGKSSREPVQPVIAHLHFK